MIWLYALASVFIVSLISLVGVITLGLKKSILNKILIYLVSFSTGTLFGGAFIHLIPEASAVVYSLNISFYILTGIITFFIIEKFVHWRHCHVPSSVDHPHSFAYMNLIGDAVHNFIDGLLIGGSYLVSIPIGITTTIAIIMHEIPQEIGDFGVLIYGGFKKKEALVFNFLTALTAVIGTLVALAIADLVGSGFPIFLISFAAGAFIYIGGSDLIPELHKHTNVRTSLLQLVSLVLGILLMFVLIGL